MAVGGSGVPRNLPTELTSFVGRRRELAQVRKLLSVSRLVTLTGQGGAGKTRLALQVAGELRRAKRDGKWLAELSSLQDAELVPQTIVAALGIRNPTEEDPAAILEAHLADRELLLVLDNCEHLIDRCAALADALLRAAPGLHILATSRRPLGVDGEHVFVVPPLSVPDPREQAPAPQALGEYESVRLFVERGQAVNPGFTVTADNGDAVAAICRALSGVPLALELAAARLRLLTPHEVLHRLDNDDDRLPAASRTAPDRHRSMRATLNWSFGLCTPDEQQLWSRLSVFPGDFSLEAAESICSGSGLRHASITSLLTGLVDQSIVTAEPVGERSRYRMLDSVRAYGRGRLSESGETERCLRRHRDYYHRLAGAAHKEWFGPLQVEWMSSMRLEQANLRAALRYSYEHPEHGVAGLAMAALLEKHWMLDGNLTEGRRWLDRGLSLVAEPRWERARGLVTGGRLALNQGNSEIAELLLTEALALGNALASADVVADATHFLGAAAQFRGDDDTAATLLADALGQHRDLGDDEGIALGLARLAMIYPDRAEDPGLSDDYFGEAVAICADRGEVMVRGFVLWNRALAIWRRGDTEQARDLVRERLHIVRTFEDPLSAAESLEALAWIAASDKEYERAATLLGSVHAQFWSIGAALFKNLAVHHDACVAAAQQELGTERYEAVFGYGAELPVGECVAYALGQAAPKQPPPASSDGIPRPLLTDRELEVAQLVGLGLSNQKIATKLVVSRRTVESHVAHILAKLDLTSRAEVTAIMANPHRLAAIRGRGGHSLNL